MVRLAALGVDTGYRRGMRVGLQDLWTGQWRSQTQTRLASLMLSCFREVLLFPSLLPFFSCPGHGDSTCWTEGHLLQNPKQGAAQPG